MGGGFVLELGEFSANGGVTGEVMDNKGRRGIGRNARRGCYDFSLFLTPTR